MSEKITIPGSMGGLDALARQLHAAAADVDSVKGRVASNGLDGAWSGQAAEAFRSSLHEMPGELGTIVTAFSDAGQAISSFAATLAELQERAAWYNTQVAEHEQHLREAQVRRAQAETKVTAARMAHSVATDPISLSTAKSALDLGESMFRGATAEAEDISVRLAQLVSGGQGVHREYEEAARRCCSALDGLRHSGGRSFSAWLHNAVSGLVGGGGERVAMWWQNGGRRLKDEAESVHDYIDSANWLVENGVPISMLGPWAVPLVRVANNSVFRFSGTVGTAFLAYETVGDVKAAYDQTSWENAPGRAFTVEVTGASDAILAWKPAAVANVVDGGSLSASIKGLGLVGGGLISGGPEGALRGDEQFANNAASGQYGGFVKAMNKGEDYVIEHPGNVGRAIVHAPANAAKALWRGGADLLHDL